MPECKKRPKGERPKHEIGAHLLSRMQRCNEREKAQQMARGRRNKVPGSPTQSLIELGRIQASKTNLETIIRSLHGQATSLMVATTGNSEFNPQ